MPSGAKVDATHAPGRGGELDSMRVEYNEHLAPWIFPRQGTHRPHAAHKVDGCARTRYVCFSQKNRGRWKKQNHDNKRTTDSMSRVHNDQHRAACTPHSTLFTTARKFQRLPSDAVYSQRCG